MTTGTTRSWRAASSLAAPSYSMRSSMTTTGTAGTSTTTSIGIAVTSPSTAATWTSTSTAATSTSATATGRASATGTDRRSATAIGSASATAIAPRSTVEISPASAIARVIGRAPGLSGEPDIDLECRQPRCRAPEDRGAQDHRGRPRKPANVAAGRLSSARVWLARPDTIPVYDPVGANNLAPQDQPDPDGESAEPFERLPAAVALAPFDVQQPRPSERRSSRWRPGRGVDGGRWWTGALG